MIDDIIDREISLAFNPISNYEFSRLNNEDALKKILSSSHLYMICQRNELIFQNVQYNPKNNFLEFEIEKKGKDERLKIIMDIYQESLTTDKTQNVHFKPYTYHVENWKKDFPYDDVRGFQLHTNQKYLWISPDSLLWSYFNNKIELEIYGDYTDFITFKVNYIGESTKQNIADRLRKHHKRLKNISEEKYLRTLNIIHEANQNEYSLSTCILYTVALETISSIIKITEADSSFPIDADSFGKSDIITKLTKVINDSDELNEQDKTFLIDKKIQYLNKPTNVGKFELPFLKYNVVLPVNFKKALKYRDKYLHGSIPKGNKLGTFHANNNNRAFELQFLVNILTLKYVGYQDFLKNRSTEMEYYAQKNRGIKDEDITINQPLYYNI